MSAIVVIVLPLPVNIPSFPSSRKASNITVPVLLMPTSTNPPENRLVLSAIVVATLQDAMRSLLPRRGTLHCLRYPTGRFTPTQ